MAIPIEHSLLAKVEAHIVTRLGRQLSPAANQLLQRLISTMEAFRMTGTRLGAASKSLLD